MCSVRYFSGEFRTKNVGIHCPSLLIISLFLSVMFHHEKRIHLTLTSLSSFLSLRLSLFLYFFLSLLSISISISLLPFLFLSLSPISSLPDWLSVPLSQLDASFVSCSPPPPALLLSILSLSVSRLLHFQCLPVAQSVERATPGEEVPGSIPAMAARSLRVGSVSV